MPEGWSPVAYRGRRYGLTRTSRAGGRSVSVYAEELGGDDVVSTNVYRTTTGDVLKPCEMPAATVLAFLEGWTAVPDGAATSQPASGARQPPSATPPGTTAAGA